LGGVGTVTTHVMRSASEFTPVRSGTRRRIGNLCSLAVTSLRRAFVSCNALQLFPAAAADAIANAWRSQWFARAGGTP